MNLRTYFRLLRPVGSLFTVIQLSTVPLALCVAFAPLDRPSYHLSVIFVVWLPPVLGACLAGAAHELMHQPLILLLPDGLRRLRNMTILGVLALSTILVAVVALFGAPISAVATFGLSAALLALPCTSRHRGFVWPLTFLAAWGVLVYLAGAGFLTRAMVADPAAFFIGGALVAAAAIADGFSPRHLRERIETSFRAPQGIFSGVRNREALRNYFRRGRHGRDWNIRSVSGSTWSWMQVLKHSVAGRRRHGSVFNWLVWVALPTAICALFLPTVFRVAGWSSASQYWEILAHLASLEPAPKPIGCDDDLNSLVWTLYPLFACILSMVSKRQPVPAVPISRDRLARALFGLGLIRWTAVWLSTTIPIFVLCVVGQFMSGKFLHGFGLPVLVTFAGSMTVILHVLPLSLFFARPFARAFPRVFGVTVVFLLLLLLIPIIVLSLERDRWLPYVLTPLGTVALVLGAAGSIAFVWKSQRRHFRTCDLVGITQ